MANARVHVIISGHVQGVFFRDSMRERARSLGVTGWVRNTSEGQVEAVLEGERDAVEKLVVWSRHGPSGAHVEEADERWEPYVGEFSGFEITNFRW